MARKRLGAMVKRLRDSKGWTQAELAKRAKVSRPYITMLESGQRKSISVAVLERLAKALGVPVTELLG